MAFIWHILRDIFKIKCDYGQICLLGYEVMLFQTCKPDRDVSDPRITEPLTTTLRDITSQNRLPSDHA